MLKKILVLLLVASIYASLLSACGGSSTDKKAQEQLAELNNKAESYINQPGWVHVTERIVYDTDKEDRGVMSNGKPIPLVQTVDVWYHINSEKLVYEYVRIMSSPDGQTIETVVYVNNVVYNLMESISNALNPYSLDTLDYQFANELTSFISSKNHPVVKTIELDGKTTTVFTLEKQLDTPRATMDYDQSIKAVGSIAYFDATSGLLVKLERTVILADGSMRTFYTDNLTIVNGVQPPPDILDYLNGLW
jgi:hypothetical protein